MPYNISRSEDLRATKMSDALRDKVTTLAHKGLGVSGSLVFWYRLVEAQRFAPFPDHPAILQVADVAIAVWRLTGRIPETAELQQILRNILEEA